MKIPTSMLRLKGFRFPRKVIAYAVWAYHRFALSTEDVEDLLAERGVMISREAIRGWVNRFGAHFAACIRRDRPRTNDKWHLDEVVIPINGVKHWLWRAVDANGDTLDILVQTRRNAKAAQRFMARLIAQFGKPRVVITDKLRSYIKPISHQAPDADQRAHKGLNNRIGGNHGALQVATASTALPCRT
jgi:putative transposase